MTRRDKAEADVKFHAMKITQAADRLFVASTGRFTRDSFQVMREALTELERRSIEAHVALNALEGK